MFAKFAGALAAMASRAEYFQIDIDSINAATIRQICDTPAHIASAFVVADTELRPLLPLAWRDLTTLERRYLFAAAVAHNLKPYGPGTTADLQSILQARTLDCSNYGLLTHYLASGYFDTSASMDVAFVGWDGGAIGNHQMLFANDTSRKAGPQLLLDPTVGLAARANFDQIASGQPLPRQNILALNATSELAASRQQIVSALDRGAFKPSDLMPIPLVPA